ISLSGVIKSILLESNENLALFFVTPVEKIVTLRVCEEGVGSVGSPGAVEPHAEYEDHQDGCQQHQAYRKSKGRHANIRAAGEIERQFGSGRPEQQDGTPTRLDPQAHSGTEPGGREDA